MRRQQGRPSVPIVGRGGRSTCYPCLVRGDRGRPDTCGGAFSHRDPGRLSVARDRVEPLDRRVMADVLDRFSPATAAWFRSSFAAPTTAQRGAWEAISSGQHTLVVAPTGSGKTLSAFLWAIDKLVTTPPDPERSACRVLYVSPLKALATDVERNLRSPLVGVGHAATRLGLSAPQISVAVRSSDTPADERRTFARHPADILITTPESLFLLLTSAAREALTVVMPVRASRAAEVSSRN